jgi:DNA-binding response OmpR family regulator
MKKRILIVEDDMALARVIRDNLVYEGFGVDCVADGQVALDQARTTHPDLILLDAMIPTLDGFEVCRQLGSVRDRIPVIMMTARTQQQDKVRGLENGADDYVTKPFALEELLARIRAVLRRSRRTVQTLSLGEATIDFERMRAWRSGAPLSFTQREFALLEYLAESAGRVVTREELLRAVWGHQHTQLTRTVDIFIARLRRKVESDPHNPRFIRTVHGDGYLLALAPKA